MLELEAIKIVTYKIVEREIVTMDPMDPEIGDKDKWVRVKIEINFNPNITLPNSEVAVILEGADSSGKYWEVWNAVVFLYDD